MFTRVVGKRLALGAATFAAGLGLVMSLAPAAAACSDHGGRMPWGAWGAPQQAVAALPFAWHHSSPMLLPQDAWGDPCDQLAPLAAPAAAPVAALQHPAALHPNRHHRGRHHVRHHHRRHHHFRTHHLQGRHLAGHRQAHLYAVRHLALRHYLVRNHALFAPAQTGFRVAPAGLVLMQPLHANHAAAHHYGARHHRVRHHGHHGHHRHHHRRHRG